MFQFQVRAQFDISMEIRISIRSGRLEIELREQVEYTFQESLVKTIDRYSSNLSRMIKKESDKRLERVEKMDKTPPQDKNKERTK